MELPHPDIETDIHKILAQLSNQNFKSSDISLSFIELGMDSLQIISLLQQLKNKYNIDISFRTIFDEIKTAEALIAYIQAHHQPVMSNVLSPQLNTTSLTKVNFSSKIKDELLNSLKQVYLAAYQQPDNELRSSTVFLENDFDISKIQVVIRSLNNHFNIALSFQQVFTEVNNLRRIRNYIINHSSEHHAIQYSENILPNVLNALIDENSNLSVLHEHLDNKSATLFNGDQQLLHLLSKMDKGGSIAFNVSGALRLTGQLNLLTLKETLYAVCKRHESLRSIISQEGTFSYVLDDYSPKLHYVDYSKYSAEDIKYKVTTYLKTETQKAFNFLSPAIRFNLVKLSPEKYVFSVTIHHVFGDGKSIGIILKDVANLYSLKRNPSTQTPLLAATQFSSFLEWQQKWLKGPSAYKQQQFWQQQESIGYPELNLPTDFIRPALKSYNGSRIVSYIDNQLYQELSAYSKSKNASMFMVVMAIYNLLLHRYSQQDALTIGTSLASRNINDNNTTVGYLSNIYPTVSRLEKTDSPEDYLNKLKSTLFDIYDNQNYPLAQLIKHSTKKRDPSKTPFFTVAFNWEVAEKIAFSDLNSTPYIPPKNYVEYDLMLNVLEDDTNLSIAWDFNSDIYKRSTIEGMMNSFNQLARSFINTPSVPCSQLNILDTQTINSMVESFKGKQQEKPNVNIITLLEKNAEIYPKNIALCFNEFAISFKQFNEEINKTAHWLLTQNITHHSRVSLLLSPSIDMYIVIAAILKTGAHFVPINPNLPMNKVDKIFDSANAEMIITDKPIEKSEKEHNVFSLQHIKKQAISFSSKNPNTKIKNNQLVYIIFTSGSTGDPKGVQISHANLVNMIYALSDKLNINEQDTVLNIANYFFDLSVPDWSMSFALGMKLIIASEDDRYAPDTLVHLLNKHSVTLAQATPTTWKMLTESQDFTEKHTLKIVCGGEEFPVNLGKKLLSRTPNVWNAYGPTENTVWTTLFKVTEESLENKFLPIGSPLTNNDLLIVDENLQILPPGIPGELLISGNSLSQGYLNDVALNAEKFITIKNLDKKTLFYRTGDLVKYHRKIGIEFLARIDNQIKIRGFRVELGEIEIALNKIPFVNSAIVLLKKLVNEQTSLTACIQTHHMDKLTNDKIRKALTLALPNYMVPSEYTFLTEWPLSINGKIDRKALADLSSNNTQCSKEKSNTSLVFTYKEDKILHHIWASILKHTRFNLHDDFFLQGGTSLDIPTLQKQIKEKFKVHITIKDLFLMSTISSISECIRKSPQLS